MRIIKIICYITVFSLEMRIIFIEVTNDTFFNTCNVYIMRVPELGKEVLGGHALKKL